MTAADELGENLLADLIQELWPSAVIIREDNCSAQEQASCVPNSGMVAFIDGLDGTTNAIRWNQRPSQLQGLPVTPSFGPAFGVMDDKGWLAGGIILLPQKLIIAASRDCGCFYRRPLMRGWTKLCLGQFEGQLKDATTASGWNYAAREDVCEQYLSHIRACRCLLSCGHNAGDQASILLSLADCGLFVTDSGPWDLAPGAACITLAGGQAVSLSGMPLHESLRGVPIGPHGAIMAKSQNLATQALDLFRGKPSVP